MEKNYLEEFKKRWLSKAEEIKKLALDADQAYRIKICFITEMPSVMARSNDQDHIFELTKLSNDVDLALEAAFSNYRTEKLKNKSFWSISLFGNELKKLPQPNFDK